MSRWQRRYEVLLPLHFNDGHAVPDDLIAQTLLELEQGFRAISCETQVIQGIWENKGQTYRDELVRAVEVLESIGNPVARRLLEPRAAGLRRGVSPTASRAVRILAFSVKAAIRPPARDNRCLVQAITRSST